MFHLQRGDKFKSAAEFHSNPPVTTGERLQGQRDEHVRKTSHADYMDFAEVYADYVVAYEKINHDKAEGPADLPNPPGMEGINATRG